MVSVVQRLPAAGAKILAPAAGKMYLLASLVGTHLAGGLYLSLVVHHQLFVMVPFLKTLRYY